MARRDNHAAARALAEWALTGYTRAGMLRIAESHGVSPRTLENWRDALKTDRELASLFKDAAGRVATGDWASHLAEALVATVTKLRHLIDASESLPEVTGAFVALTDVALEKEALRAALEAESAYGTIPAGATGHRDHAGVGPN